MMEDRRQQKKARAATTIQRGDIRAWFRASDIRTETIFDHAFCNTSVWRAWFRLKRRSVGDDALELLSEIRYLATSDFGNLNNEAKPPNQVLMCIALNHGGALQPPMLDIAGRVPLVRRLACVDREVCLQGIVDVITGVIEFRGAGMQARHT